MKLQVFSILLVIACTFASHDHDHHDHDHKDCKDHKEDDREHAKHDKEHLKNIEAEGIVPEVISKVPAKAVEVEFDKKEVDFGNELTPTQVKDEPKVSWEADKDTYYTLSMVDPDAPSRKEPKFREVNHWLVTNILGNDVSKGEVITAFMSSGPPKDTGLHRYVFLVFKQPKKLEVTEPKTGAFSREHRLNFSIKKFAEKYQLGDPIAANFYKAQYDSYVDERNKKIKN